MSRKKVKKVIKPIDQATKDRITAKRQRKAQRRLEKTKKLELEAHNRDTLDTLKRELKKTPNEWLEKNAILVLKINEQVKAGILSDPTKEGWIYVLDDIEWRASFYSNAVEAVLSLYSAQEMGQKNEIVECNHCAHQLLEETRNSLKSEYDSGLLDPFDVQTFYESFADEDTKLILECFYLSHPNSELWRIWGLSKSIDILETKRALEIDSKKEIQEQIFYLSNTYPDDIYDTIE